jgi:hypothetical protein
MTALRKMQADQVAERYMQMQRLLDELEAVHEGEPDVTNCSDLEEIAVRRGRLTPEERKERRTRS